jgi:ABC-type amino acid transport substrate-binding protein
MLHFNLCKEEEQRCNKKLRNVVQIKLNHRFTSFSERVGECCMMLLLRHALSVVMTVLVLATGAKHASICHASAVENLGGGQTAIPEVAMFRDATEVLFAVAERRRVSDPGAPWVPRRHFVKDADEAHRIAFEGPNPIVGMSLDDLIECSRTSHPNAGQLVAFSGVHRGFLHLMATPEIKSVADLKGKRIAVDTDTGYASALFEILRRNGLKRGRDSEVVYAGATNLRYEKLLRGEFDATLLGAPFTRLAMRQGYNSLGTVIDALGGYQAVVLVASRAWLAQNKEMASAVASCLIETFKWASLPENHEKVEVYVGEILGGLGGPAAKQVTQDLFGPASEFLPNGRMRDGDTAVVIDLFNASRGATITQDTVSKLTDVGAKMGQPSKPD